MRKILISLGSIFLIFSLVGCAEMSAFFKSYKLTNRYTHPEFRRFKLHDIGVVPLKNESAARKDISGAITNQLITELNKRGWYVIHPIKEEDLASPERLSNIDAVLIGSIIDYRDVEPLRFGIKLTMLDLNTKETIWSAQEIFDAASSKVTESVNYYYRSLADKRNPLMGHRLYLVSINKFVEYAFNTVIKTLDQAIREKLAADQKELEERKKAARDEEMQAGSEERKERIKNVERKSKEKEKTLDSATLILGG